jgi:LysM repeat protein
MKMLPIFLPVAALHVGLMVLLLAQPGCRTRKTPPPPEGAEKTVVPATTTAPQSAVAPQPVVERQPPMRPVNSSTTTATDTSDLPSAFNGGLAIESNESVLQPLTEPDYYEPLTETYAVVSGDTLSGIARKFGTTVAELRSANGLTGDTIYLGQELMIPAQSSVDVSSSYSTDSASYTSSSGETYTVKPGDNLTKIARSHGSSVADIRAANGLSSDRINVGQVLTIPSGGTSYSPAPVQTRTTSIPSNVPTYTVKAGDTLSGIGARLGVSYRSIMDANGITDPTRLKVGQVLAVPGAKASATTSTVKPAAPVTPPPPSRSIVPPVETRPATPQVSVQPSQPVELEDDFQLDPSELEARLNELPISDSEVAEPVE